MRTLSLFLLMWMGGFSFANAQQQVTIDGFACEEWKDGAPLSLSVNGEVMKTAVKDGRYSFEFSLEEPLFLRVTHEKGMGQVSFMASPGDKITLSGSVRKPKIEGARLQADVEKYIIGPFRAQNQKRVELSQKYKDMLSRLYNPDTEEETKQTPEYKEYMQEKNAMENSFTAELQAAFRENANTIWAPLSTNYNPSIKPTEELYACLSEEVKDSYYGREMRKQLDAMLTGKQAPGFTLKDAEGKEYSLNQLLEGNQYLLVDFWASWCGPCRKGIPEVKEFAKKYAGKGLAVLSISIDTDRNAWLKALEEEQMPWTNLLDDAGVSKQYGVKGIPSVFLLKADGTVLFEKLYGEAIGRELKKALGE